MSIENLVEYLIKNIVKNVDAVSVKKYDDNDEYITIEVMVDSSDMGVVIGKNGATANSIRTITQAAAYANGLKKIKINFDSF